jgi:exonuclease SbcC
LLQKIKTTNFFAVKKKEVDLHPRITTLVGKSASGKSSLIRSLRWLVLNRPAGDRFIHWGQKEASVKLEVDGHKILRKRGKSENLYSLDGDEFRSFQNNVPEEITSLLSCTELNFQRQHELHFWFSLTAGEVAKQLNQIVNLEIIDLASSRIASKLREAKATLTVEKNRIDDLRQQKRALRWVKDANLELKEVEKLNSRLAILSEQEMDLSISVENAKQLQKRITVTSKTAKKGTKLLGTIEKLLQVQETQSILNSVINAAESMQRVSAQSVPDIKGLDDLVFKCVSQASKNRSLCLLIRQIHDMTEVRDKWKNENEVAQKELKKAMKGNCPICQRPIK